MDRLRKQKTWPLYRIAVFGASWVVTIHGKDIINETEEQIWHNVDTRQKMKRVRNEDCYVWIISNCDIISFRCIILTQIKKDREKREENWNKREGFIYSCLLQKIMKPDSHCLIPRKPLTRYAHMPKDPQLPKPSRKKTETKPYISWVCLKLRLSCSVWYSSSSSSVFVVIIFNVALLACHMQKLMVEEKPLLAEGGREGGRELDRRVFLTLIKGLWVRWGGSSKHMPWALSW